jgi:hypothetical protein
MNPAATTDYRQNRDKFSIEELRKRNGDWVAFSADRQRIIASAATIAELANQVRALHQDLRDFVLEHIEIESTDIYLGAAE